MNRRSILAAYKKKSSHLQTGVTGFKSGNLFNQYHEVLAQEKSPEGKGQSFDLGGAVITSLLLDNLKKANDPSPFPALTQLEVWGTNV